MLFKIDEKKQLVGTVIETPDNFGGLSISAHDGTGNYLIQSSKCRIVKELRPAEMWERWAMGAASVENEDLREKTKDDFRWLLDGYRYVPGGRIQTMLGREYSPYDGNKSKLSAYNCLVLPSPDCSEAKTNLENMQEIIKIAKREANSMAYGCGVGINISTVLDRINCPDVKQNIYFFMCQDHKEYADITEDTFFNLKQIIPGNVTPEAADHLLVEDSREGIFDALATMVEHLYTKNWALILDFSALRAKGEYVKGIDGVSSGAISWMKMFDFLVGKLHVGPINVVDVAEFYSLIPHLISQGGQRRGALMEVLNVDHSGIKEFIKAKKDYGKITGANLSVNMTENFILNMDEDKEKQEILDFIAQYAHRTGEPGVLFMDRAQKDSNTSMLEVIDAVNPCAEEPLPPDNVCCLGHHYLPAYLVYEQETGLYTFNLTGLKRAVQLAVRFQDNLIDYTGYFDQSMEFAQKSSRRIGIGTMGLATVLIKLGLRYGSEDAKEFVSMLYEAIAVQTYRASIALGEEKGSYTHFNPNKISKECFMYRLLGAFPTYMRNAALLTQAPTGSTGTMVENIPGYDCSTGIEPYYSFEYYRASRTGTVKQEVELAMQYKAQHPGEELPDYFVTAQDLTPTEHVEMQATVQQYVDAAISKTINMPSTATVEEVKQAYRMAYNTGCKGVAVYVDGSRAGQVLSTDKDRARIDDDLTAKVVKTPSTPIPTVVPKYPKSFKKRPKVLDGSTIKQDTPLGKMYMTINSDNGDGVEEVFLHLGKVGSDIRAITDAVAILLTLSLSERLARLTQAEKINWIISKFIGIKGANNIGFGPNRVDSLPDAIGKAMKQLFHENDEVEIDEIDEQDHFEALSASDICPNCGQAALMKVEGCEKCSACGNAKCS